MTNTFISFLFLLLLSLSIVSCGKGGGGSSSPTSSSETGGDISGPEELPQTGEEYIPQGLSDKVIVKNGISHAPMDFLSQTLTMTFDPDAGTAKGHSVIKFRLRKSGRPYFELQSTVKNIKLDSVATTATSIKDSDGQNQSYWSVDEEVSAGVVHTVELDYELASGRVSFVNDGVRFLTDMTDLSGKFFEYWGPVGFEEDAFPMTLNLEVKNSASKHKLYTNGESTQPGNYSWKITFPDYFSKSSFYVHLTNQTTLPSKTLVYKGLKKEIPIEVYGLTNALVDAAVAELPKLFKELEADYGPYPHAKFLAYLNDRSGGMEYVGATITSVASIDHELLHSWFARSVIPADGRSGWIDEAVASWRDYGYTRASSTLKRTPTNLANYSPFRKTTPSNSYVDGRALMAELDREFSSQGGMKLILRAFFEKYKNKVVNNEEFWSFLEEYTKTDVSAFNLRYALGGNAAEELAAKRVINPMEVSKHPTPLTEEEILRLR